VNRLFTDEPGDDGLPGQARRIAVTVLIIGTLMAVLDGSIVNIALPTIATELHAPASTTIWVANAFRLVSAMGLMSFASLGDVIGYRRVYLFGLYVFTLASLGCALSQNLGLLIAMRSLQGFGAASMLSVGPALYRNIFPMRLLGSALGLSALVVASGMAAGPSIGGGILAVLGWPWLFAFNVPLGLVTIVLARRALPREPGRGGRFDFAGSALSAIALGSFVLAVDGLSGQKAGAWVVPLFALSLAAAVAFIRRQKRTPLPLLPLDIFASRRFSMAAVTSFTAFTAQGISFITLPFLFQSIQGYSPFMSAVLFTPWPIVIIAAGPVAGRLSDRVNPAVISTGGLALFSLGMASLALLGPSATVPDIIWRTALSGLGYGLFQAPNNREMLGNVPRERSGSASGILASARTFGQSLGAALVAIVLAGSAGRLSPAGAAILSVHTALWIGCGVGVIAILLSAGRIRSDTGTARSLPG